MVREARFSWDETDRVHIPQRSSEFDGLDDLMFDDLSRLNPRQKSAPRGEAGKQSRKKEQKRDSRRHLAGADWTSDKTAPAANDRQPSVDAE